jgi:hypothetical protein
MVGASNNQLIIENSTDRWAQSEDLKVHDKFNSSGLLGPEQSEGVDMHLCPRAILDRLRLGLRCPSEDILRTSCASKAGFAVKLQWPESMVFLQYFQSF